MTRPEVGQVWAFSFADGRRLLFLVLRAWDYETMDVVSLEDGERNTFVMREDRSTGLGWSRLA